MPEAEVFNPPAFENAEFMPEFSVVKSAEIIDSCGLSEPPFIDIRVNRNK
jgi:hypothetical protein